jgi:hypothetical protein
LYSEGFNGDDYVDFPIIVRKTIIRIAIAAAAAIVWGILSVETKEYTTIAPPFALFGCLFLGAAWLNYLMIDEVISPFKKGIRINKRAGFFGDEARFNGRVIAYLDNVHNLPGAAAKNDTEVAAELTSGAVSSAAEPASAESASGKAAFRINIIANIAAAAVVIIISFVVM